MDFRLQFKFAVTVATVFLIPESLVYANLLPGSVYPAQVAKQLMPKPSLVPTGVAPQPVQNRETAQHTALTDSAKKITFKLNGISISDNHVFTEEQLAPLYKDKIGKTISVADLFAVVQNITNFYRNNGYIISRAILPPQHVKGGFVEIQVIEGYIDHIAVTGTPRGAKCLVEGFGYHIRKCPPLQVKNLEKYMLLTNEIPGTAVKAVLAPSKSSPGAADLNLETYTKLMTAYFSYDNYGTRYIGPQQMTGNVTAYSMINSGDSISFTYTKTPKGGELGFTDLNYSGPVGDQGSRWTLGATRVHTHPLYILTPTETDGFNSNFYTGFTYPMIRTRSQSLNLTTGFNYLDSDTTTFAGQLYNDHIRSLDFGFTYNFADSHYGANLIAANFRKGLPFLGYNNDTTETASTSRPGGYAAYQKIAAQYSRLQAIKGPVSLFFVAKGQWAFVPLLSSEQFTFGGNPLGRGYDPAELIGDRGVASSLELRYDMGFANKMVQNLQFYGYYDIGSIWNILVTNSSSTKVSASSAGFGVRFTMTRYISGNLMWTQPLTKTVAAEQFIGRGWRPRTFFSIVASLD